MAQKIPRTLLLDPRRKWMVMLIVFAQVGWGELFVSHTYRGLQRGLDIIHLCNKNPKRFSNSSRVDIHISRV